MNLVARARAGFAVGCLLVVLGVGMLLGLAWALIAAGVVLAVSCLVLVNVDERGASE